MLCLVNSRAVQSVGANKFKNNNYRQTLTHVSTNNSKCKFLFRSEWRHKSTLCKWLLHKSWLLLVYQSKTRPSGCSTFSQMTVCLLMSQSN